MTEESIIPETEEKISNSWSNAVGQPLIDQASHALGLIEKYLDYKTKELRSRYLLTSIVFAVVALAVLVACSVLTALKVVSSDSFTFLIGALVGYLAIYVRSAIGRNKDE